MLEEPSLDAHRLAADRALLQAVAARAALGPHGGPDAEALALRALLAEVEPERRPLLRALWSRLEKGGPPPLVWGGEAAVLAADRFGLPLEIVAEPELALNAVAGARRAVLSLQERKPWWGRLLARPALRVIGALPDDLAPKPRALVVAEAQPGPTGGDRTFWTTDSPWPVGRIVEALSGRGLAATPLVLVGGLKLFALAGYVQAEDGRLLDAPGDLRGVIGAAPAF
jgi:hypothetical protein